MTTRDSAWMDLYQQADKHRNDAVARADQIVWSILAGESATVFGKRVEFTLSWPDGLPLNLADEAALRELAATEVAKIRARWTSEPDQKSDAT